jgi:2-amino-4-hydroxy-6-hydroxymethyldihydropteridine diphosphokinase
MADPALDKIHIRDLLMRCILGVNEEERREKQDVLLNITLYADLREACRSDRLEDTVDYKAIKKRVIAEVERSSYYLVERLAERIAEICLEDNRVRRVQVAVEKPGALRFARTVGIEIVRERTVPATYTAYIAVGSNVESEKNIPRALERLRRRVRVTASSSFSRTAPVGPADQPPFLNGVWKIVTTASPRSLKYEVLRSIETELGRHRTEDRYAPRPIDLDILLFGDAVIDEPDLRIPDPDILERPFLAGALLELDPDLVLPDRGKPLHSLVSPEAQAARVPAEAVTKMLKAIIAEADSKAKTE